MGGIALIADVKYVCVGGSVGMDVCVCVCGCDFAWVRKRVCGWGSLDCCCKVSHIVCVGGGRLRG